MIDIKKKVQAARDYASKSYRVIRKISKWRIKRGVNFHDEMRKGKYGWNEAAHLGWF